MILDHVMHGVQDLVAASARMQSLGIRVVQGGQHPGWGTHNTLAYFGLNYLEWIAVHDEQEAARSDVGKHVLADILRGDGPITVAFRTDTMDADVAAMRASGLAVQGPFASSRQRPDGSVVAWRLALLPWPWPFLIEWQLADAERAADLKGRGVIGRHPLGEQLQLRGVGWAVRDLEQGIIWLRNTYGLTVGTPYTDDQLNARCAASDSGLVLCAPVAPGPTAERLETRGEGPFLYELTGDVAGATLVKPQEACGAWIRIARGEENQ